MGSLTAQIKDAKKAADPMTVARRLRLNPVLGSTGNAKFVCPFQPDGKAEANLFKKKMGHNVGELGFNCDACVEEVASGTRERMPDPINLAEHVLGCNKHDVVKWLEKVNAGQEPAPVAKKPATAPKVEKWDPMVKGTKLGLGVLFGDPGAFAGADNCLYVALTAADYEFAREFRARKGEDPEKVPLVYVDSPEQWTALRTLLPAKMSGEILYRGEPSKSHMELLAFAESKGRRCGLVDLDEVDARPPEDDEDDQDQDEPVAAPRESLASKQRDLQHAIDAIDLPEDHPLKAPTTPIAPSVQAPTTPIAPSVQVSTTPVESSVQAPTTPEPPAPRVVTTPEPAPVAVSTAQMTPQHRGRPVGPRLTARLDPTARRQEYAVDTAPIAEAFLRELLASAPVAAQEVVKLARDRGISRGQVRAARDVLKVVSLFPSACWCLPDHLPAR